MPGDNAPSGKTRGVAAWRRNRSSAGDNEVTAAHGFRANGTLPEDVRKRLHDLFGRIEQEFDKLYMENLSLHDKVDALTERLDSCLSVGADKQDAGGTLEENGQKPVKKVSHFSQKLKSTYKTSTSRIANTFKAAGCGHYVRDYRGHTDGVWEVSVSKWNGSPRFIGTASADFTAKVWSADTGAVHLDYYGHHGSVNSIRFHPFNDLVVTGSGDQTAHVWKLQLTSQPPQPVQSGATTPALDGQRASSDEELDEMAAADELPAPSPETGGSTHFAHMPLLRLGGHTDVVVAADWLCDGRRVVTASWDGLAIVHDVERAGEGGSSAVDSLCGHENELTNVCTTHSSQKLLLTSSKDLSLRLWDLRVASTAVNLFMGHTASVSSAVFAPGDKIISGSNDRTVKLWDMRNMAAPYMTIRSDSAVNRLSVCPVTGVIAVPHDNRHVRLYDIHGARLGRLPRSNRQGHTRMVCSTAWADDVGSSSSNLYSSGFDRLVIGWHVNSKQDAKDSSAKK